VICVRDFSRGSFGESRKVGIMEFGLYAAGPIMALTQWEGAWRTYGQDWILVWRLRNASHEEASTISPAR